MNLKIALCSLNPLVGDLNGNRALIVAAYRNAVDQGTDIVLTPEMSLTGYPLEDLTQKPAFLRSVANAAEELQLEIAALGHTAALVFGHPTDTGIDDGNRRLIYNSATFLDPATADTQTVHKSELPNYGVFDEKRNYLEGPTPGIIEWRGLRLGLLICEDGWFDRVTETLSAQGADLLLWVNGSPFAQGKNVARRRHASNRFAEARVPIAYVNLVGGQDELVFDGDRFFFDGEHYVEGQSFTASCQIVTADVQRGQALRTPGPMLVIPPVPPTTVPDIYNAIVVGVRDYLAKSRFEKVVIGYSGGVDSGLVAAIACDALGPENVLLVRLPSGFSSAGSLDDAWTGAGRLGSPLRTIRIEPAVNAMRALYSAMEFDTETPATNPMLTGVSDENIQARVRGMILMGISNQEGFMLLNTTNLSEGLTGYGTLHGDMAGGYAPLKDVLKTTVWELCRYRNGLDQAEIALRSYRGRVADVVPEAIIVKPPSAELRADQQDTDSLPAYPILDAILTSLVFEECSVDETVDAGSPIARLCNASKTLFTAPNTNDGLPRRE